MAQFNSFSQRAIYNFGASEPTRAAIVTAPLLSGTELRSVSSTQAELAWEPVNNAKSYLVWIEPEVEGQHNPLKVSLTRHALCPQHITIRRNCSHDNLQVLTNGLTVPGLAMKTNYNITLVGELADSTTDKSNAIAFATSPPPPMLIIDEIKSTSMQLSSSFIQDAVQYEIIYYPTREPEYDAMVTLHGHNVQRIIDDLDADTFYTFKLRAVMNDNTHTDWTDAVYTTGK